MNHRHPYRRRGGFGRRNREPVPLLLVPDDDGSALGYLLGALARLTWRHRSALAPLALAGVVFGVGAWLHATHPGYWPWLAGATAVIVTLIGALPSTWGRWWAPLGRRAERVYAGVSTAVTGGWLTSATLVGATVKPLPLVWAIGTLLCAVPWWAHRRRRARVRVERAIGAWPDIAETVGLKDSRIVSAVVDAWGWTARLALRRGQTARHAIDAIGAIESGLGVRPGSVRVEPDPARADRAMMRVVESDPHAAPIPYPRQAGDGTASITRPIPLGVFEDGQPVHVSLLRRNALVGGVVGSGKSGVVNVVLAALTACPDVAVWGIDLKGGMEIGPWMPALDRMATTPDAAVALLADAVAELDARATEQAARGERVWQPTPSRPALIIVIDEYAELPDEAAPLTDSLARRGRAVAVTLLAATQRPTQQAMGGGAVRSQMDVRVCLRVRERRDVDLILGQGMLNAGWHAHELNAPGKFLISSPEHGTPKRARAYLFTDTDVDHTAKTHAGNRPTVAIRQPSERPQESANTENRATPTIPRQRQSSEDHAESLLWVVLCDAPEEGISAAELMEFVGKPRAWVYRRLQRLEAEGRATRGAWGRWQPVLPDEPPEAASDQP
jgi:DNA segregation ATPase FtsK/SpoIIIE, S-DNA-T family